MEIKPTSKLQDVFSWVATILGFIVDTFALMQLFSFLKFRSLDFDPINVALPKFNIDNSLRWKDATLVIIIYSAFSLVLFIKTMLANSEKYNKVKDDTNAIISFLATNFLLLVIFLWLLVFAFTNNTYPYFYQIIITWLVSTLFSIGYINLYFVKEGTTGFIYFSRLIIVYLFSAPALSLMTEYLLSVSLIQAFVITLTWFIVAVLYSIFSISIWYGLLIGVVGFTALQKGE